MHGLPLTPELKARVRSAGLPLYSAGALAGAGAGAATMNQPQEDTAVGYRRGGRVQHLAGGGSAQNTVTYPPLGITVHDDPNPASLYGLGPSFRFIEYGTDAPPPPPPVVPPVTPPVVTPPGPGTGGGGYGGQGGGGYGGGGYGGYGGNSGYGSNVARHPADVSAALAGVAPDPADPGYFTVPQWVDNLYRGVEAVMPWQVSLPMALAHTAAQGYNTWVGDQARQTQGVSPLDFGQWAGSLMGLNPYGDLHNPLVANQEQFGQAVDRYNAEVPNPLHDLFDYKPGKVAETLTGEPANYGPWGLFGTSGPAVPYSQANAVLGHGPGVIDASTAQALAQQMLTQPPSLRNPTIISEATARMLAAEDRASWGMNAPARQVYSDPIGPTITGAPLPSHAFNPKTDAGRNSPYGPSGTLGGPNAGGLQGGSWGTGLGGYEAGVGGSDIGGGYADPTAGEHSGFMARGGRVSDDLYAHARPTTSDYVGHPGRSELAGLVDSLNQAGQYDDMFRSRPQPPRHRPLGPLAAAQSSAAPTLDLGLDDYRELPPLDPAPPPYQDVAQPPLPTPPTAVEPPAPAVAQAPPTDQAPGGPVDPNAYARQVAALESGGGQNLINPTTGAAGRYQFLKSTWNDLARRYPNLKLPAFDKMNWQDQAPQDLALNALTGENVTQLKRRYGVAQPGPVEQYATHLLGASGGGRLLAALRADPQAPVTRYVAPAAAVANRNVFYGPAGPLTVQQAYDRISRSLAAGRWDRAA